MSQKIADITSGSDSTSMHSPPNSVSFLESSNSSQDEIIADQPSKLATISDKNLTQPEISNDILLVETQTHESTSLLIKESQSESIPLEDNKNLYKTSSISAKATKMRDSSPNNRTDHILPAVEESASTPILPPVDTISNPKSFPKKLSKKSGSKRTLKSLDHQNFIVNQQPQATSAAAAGYAISPAKEKIYNTEHIKIHKISEPIVIQSEPIKYKIHGLVDHFSSEIPHELVGKLSPDEFKITMSKINKFLKHNLKKQYRLLIFGALFCGCTAGLSLIPGYKNNSEILSNLKKILDDENERIYIRLLNMRWGLIIRPVHRFLEYNLILEFIPRYNFTVPD